MIKNASDAAAIAIWLAKSGGLSEVTADELLLGALHLISHYGIATLGPWTFDLEALGVDWLEASSPTPAKIAYSQVAVDLFDRAARIARSSSAPAIQVPHLLAAFASETTGLFGRLQASHGITSATWRAAIAQLPAPPPPPAPEDPAPPRDSTPAAAAPRDFLTPEEAAEALGIHVQTLRAYVRSGKLPALRLAGERAIRIRRADLETVLEPLVPQP